jgi:ribosomal protein S18 acetylase RimI-like enzyme
MKDTGVAVSLRPATADDHDFVLALYLEGPRELLSARGKWDERRFIERFEKAFRPNTTQVICAHGGAIGWIHTSESPDRFHLHYILISAPFRDRGIGTRLIEGLRERARASGKPLTLNVMRGNVRAIALYQRLGFRTVGGDEERLHMRWDGRPRHRSASATPTGDQRLRKS